MLVDTSTVATQKRFQDSPLWKPWMKDIRLRQIGSIEELEEFLEDGEHKDTISWDIETSSLDPTPDTIVGHCLAFNGNEGIYVPVAHKQDPKENLDKKEVWALISKAIEPPRKLLVYNYKFEGLFLFLSDFKRLSALKHLRDCMIYVWLWDSNRKRLNLKEASEDIIGLQMLEIHEVPGFLIKHGKVKSSDFSRTKPSEATLYAAADPVCTFRIYDKIFAEVDEEQPFIVKLEHALLDPLIQMEMNPTYLDRKFLKEGMKDLARWRDQMAEIIYKKAGYDFNIGSNVAVGQFLKKCGVSLPKTKSGKQDATGADVIEKLAEEHPECAMIMTYRSLEKERGTYAKKLLDCTSDEKPYCSFKFKSVGAPTGRFASGGVDEFESRYADINVQSIPSADSYKDVRARIVHNPPIVDMDAALKQIGSIEFEEDPADTQEDQEALDLFSEEEMAI